MSVLSTLGRLLVGDIPASDVQTRVAAEVFPSWEQQLTAFHNRRAPAWGPASVDDALTVPAIFRAVTLISNTVGMLNLETYRNKVLITDPLEVPRITIRPNPRSRPRDFWRDTAFYLATRGEAWWYIAKRDVDGNPISLFPVPPWEIVVEKDPRNRLEPTIRWADRLMDNDDLRQITYLPDRDGLRGVGPLQMCGAAVSISVEAQTWAANFFAGSVPSIVGSTEMDMSPAEAAILDDQWAAKASNLPRWLPLGIKVEDFSVDMSKAQAVEQRRFNDGQAAVMFGIPGSLLEYSMPGSSLTYQNVEGEYTKLVRTCLQPNYLEPIEQEMSDLLTRTHTSRFNTNEVTRADLKSRSEVYKNLIDAGVAPEVAAQIVGFETLDPDAINIAPVPASPPGAEITTLPPDIRSSHTSVSVRCQQCNKLLAEFASPPYRMTCSRCKAVTASNGHVQEHPMLEMMRAAVGREQPNNITVNPPSIHFETGAFRIAATDLSPMAELAGSITELAARPAPVNEITVQPADVHIDEGAVRVEFTPSPVTVEAPHITVEPPVVNVNVPEQRPMRKQIGRDPEGNILSITEEPA
jgi:HK97 family phage portal protein